MAGEAYTLPAGIIPVDQVKPAVNIEEKTVDPVRIDPEFRGLIPPLNPAEKEELKRSLQKEGCRDKLVVCRLDGKCVLLDGHNRYDICNENEPRIPFETTEIAVSDRIEAKIWILMNQRARRNLDESQRAMLAVALKDLYAEEAKQRQGTRTDLGKNLDEGKAGRSAKKAADDMGVSHQTVMYAEKVAKNGIPKLAELVNSGKVAVSAAAKATSLTTDQQQQIAEKAEDRIKDNKHPNISAIIRELFPKSLENDAKERFGKSKKNLATCLKLLDGIEAAHSAEVLSEMQDMVEKLRARLNEIGKKLPDSSCQEAAPASDDHAAESTEEPINADSENDASESEDVLTGLGKDDPDCTEDESSNCMYDYAEMPEDWGDYRAAIELENLEQMEV
jgi:hypothetical protein